jgi:transposase
VHSSGKTVTGVARQLGVSAEGLRHWVKQNAIDRGQGARGDLTTAGREELRRLRRLTAGQAETIEVLRKRMIGRIFASTVGRGKHTMPPPEICRVFAEYGNNRMATGIVVARLNSVGVTTRGAEDGGDQERRLAAKYSDLSPQSRAEWPRMARALGL